MKKKFASLLAFILLTFTTPDVLGQKNLPINYIKASTISHTQLANIAPNLSATGNLTYCPGGATKIVTDMTIVDPDDIGIDAIYIQISSGYSFGEDLLTLTGIHPNIVSVWNTTTGTLTLTGISSQPTYFELKAAIEDIEFSSSATNPTGIRNFSISVGQANYLPSNGHYYLFVPNIGITWTAAQAAAQASTYYGLQGYLATITSAEEAQIAGEQTIGAGWIGGSDQETEGIWKWMTGPEAGTVFWNGNFTGFTTTFAFWNTAEPNNSGDEDYAHVTAPGVGIAGSWNDLSNTGGTSGAYQPKGYVVEYGGMPGDPILHISTSTTMTIPTISAIPTAPRCGPGTVNLQATSTSGSVNWYEFPSGGMPLGSGNSFTTPIISDTTIYYAAAHYGGCLDISRIPINALVTPKPLLSFNSPYYMCDESYKVIDVETSLGVMFWYDSPTNPNPIFLGTHFVVPNIHEDTVFYAEANYNNCLSDRLPVQVNVYGVPDVNDETIVLCEGQTTILNAGNPNMTYLWSTGETTQTIITHGLTNYSVVITTLAPESCSKTKNFTIAYHSKPIISSIDIQNLTATINTVQSGDFEYSLDGVNFQNSNVFTVLEGGSYIGYVREKNQCGKDQKPFAVISYPIFFTPNGDGINDNWYVKGASNFSTAEVTIFDRFGKLITVLNKANPYWNGTLNGKQLPANDYWFVARINNSFPETKGHFSLKR
ncbi:T9SS type B sorting domain-containing protein [Flavobacterium paronense]|uniref:T9SS type B sorting domain-containing protein n=1 Tax=Flavobacterium paronense TaxID=1392775 RepID=A0ABV5GD24_9FLAO|nr:T9SS type B sorting domain-containing protein [Flavobacterium paronense]MDN3676151.1 T9SS type B sorting domain-containing protein [Flavobacterium paronense]